MLVSREDAARMGWEAVEIIKSGRYRSSGGRDVAVRDGLELSIAGAVSYPAEVECPLPEPGRGRHTTRVSVVNTTTLEAARRIVEDGRRPAALNFASATHPGGGFLAGARAQEESLCWSSGLFACLDGNAMYAVHQSRDDVLYTDTVLYAPDVPVFRGPDGQLLDESWRCSFLTSPAPMAYHHLDEHPDGASALRRAFETRIPKVLAVASLHGHEDLVLGAWGCGAFGNDPKMVAPLFRDALEGPFRGVFREVVFAVLDTRPDLAIFRPFAETFEDGVA